MARIGVWTGTLKKSTKLVWRGSPTVDKVFSPPANICATAHITKILIIKLATNAHRTLHYFVPRGDAGAGGPSRVYVLRIPSVSLKATKLGGLSESPYKKGGPVSV